MINNKKDIRGGMKDKTTRFLIISGILTVVFCVVIFAAQAVHMSSRSAEAINELGDIYISGMSEQTARHFGTTIELRMSQVSAIVDSVPPRGGVDSSMRLTLSYNARARGFSYLALCAEDGTMEMLYGVPLAFDDPDSFLASLTRGEQKMSVGHDADGGEAILLGVPAAYPMADGTESIALVAGLPTSYITDTLSVGLGDSLIYYAIIRNDGSFILRDSLMEEENYFERVRSRYGSVGDRSPEQYIEELSAAMQENENYSSEFTIDGERRFLYCTSLPYSDWFMIMFLPYGRLDRTVDTLGAQWARTSVGGCAVVLVVLLLVFLRYFYLTRQQMRELDAARRLAEQTSRAKSEFLSNMSHDIRTPMNGIVGMTAIASANIENTPKVRNCLKKIELSSKHLLGLVNDILDMSKIESGKLTLNFEQVSLQDTIQNIVDMVQPQIKTRRQSFDVYVRDSIAEKVYCDSVRLNQVILNLVGNAIKFTPEEGSIQVSLDEEDSPLGASHVRVHLRVRDTGIGMSPEFKEKIFESFMREDNARVQKTEGSGLGMTITKYIVDAMQGSIEVESELGRGSEFHVTLDLEKASVSEAEMRLPAWEALVADDDELLCESTVAGLKALGVKAEWVFSGESAIEQVKERRAQGRDFDVIILDWKLPNKNGVETAREIRRYCGGQTPIILTSAYDWGEYEAEARAAGIDNFLEKPLFRSNLYYCLKQYDRSADAGELQSTSRTIDYSGRRFLVAEDNDLNWEIAQELISELGAGVERAENGQVCVEKFEQSERGYYDAILMDIRMPLMTGYEATRKIRSMEREDARSIPIIAMSADAFSDDVERALESGMNAHVAKPIDMDELTGQLARNIGNRDGRKTEEEQG